MCTKAQTILKTMNYSSDVQKKTYITQKTIKQKHVFYNFKSSKVISEYIIQYYISNTKISNHVQT
jgi:hypothetical protein